MRRRAAMKPGWSSCDVEWGGLGLGKNRNETAEQPNIKEKAQKAAWKDDVASCEARTKRGATSAPMPKQQCCDDIVRRCMRHARIKL
jgi:hypothetical protein